MKTTVILLGHGSRADEGNVALAEVAVLVRDLSGMDIIPAYLQFCEPTLADSVGVAASFGANKIVVVPYFLYSGNHVMLDIPEELDKLRAEHSGIEIVITEYLGAHEKLAQIVIERIKGI